MFSEYPVWATCLYARYICVHRLELITHYWIRYFYSYWWMKAFYVVITYGSYEDLKYLKILITFNFRRYLTSWHLILVKDSCKEIFLYIHFTACISPNFTDPQYSLYFISEILMPWSRFEPGPLGFGERRLVSPWPLDQGRSRIYRNIYFTLSCCYYSWSIFVSLGPHGILVWYLLFPLFIV